MAVSSSYLFMCLLSALPGPPGVRIEDAYVQLYPLNKHKCHEIDPVRDISYQLFTRSRWFAIVTLTAQSTPAITTTNWR
ncbi:unnamed protein product [Callosobruchus maculatus]|uniref:Secreted protein n=1 Tax=Callosobruchus maculatus TaxID=64391 RepID=A0A653DZH2_CALMS|nr:unnamed protein product [Callosobruchus maculatus]